MYLFFLDPLCPIFSFFFFQAEDGIRDATVTGVQTCALPISSCRADSCTHKLLNQAASDVADGDVTFLDALRVVRRNIQEKANLAGERAASFACKRHKKRAARTPGLHSAHDIGAIAARRQRHKNVLSCDK